MRGFVEYSSQITLAPPNFTLNKQAGFAVPHSSLTIGWGGVGVGLGLGVWLGFSWGWAGLWLGLGWG